ncbi:MAG: nitrate reductase [Sulfurimonas sp. RIFOXYD12_FULL_33_39]|uniref:nitrate reductase cytochrome c-type subunit n=1 Tax=unclassified Sulfurimonas TaxID=2623549 RepID=UPI0008CDCA04|nr:MULTISPECIES: nitrate reductase cytochrome c-type subunit [unclassified Sulfurimonas]OHE07473.1 MAG: nitrate reductase [Sulfurimonas sp. RIFCSPLOWO2_12_FULL_34_6]OHE10231.1 MAG: nitrate reductase [Sulfurimonas sp. RIFOXYD12_FULL_33_39]OHE14548.1 MAG: nitrate reductase [Sulfurimonas sp. RIFOXYD2_FULL_34_21]
MKAMSKITIGLVAAALLMVGCGGEGAKSSPKKVVSTTITEESLGLRKTDLYTEDSTIADKTEYRTAQATTSSKIKRAFQDAPPMIPHDTIGMLPIKVEDNRCVSCHMPDIAGAMGATPIPVSHFTNFRERNKVVNGTFQSAVNNYKNEVSIVHEDKLQGARFNCSQCHAPQSQGNLAVENTFEPVYTSKDGANRSSWSGGKLTESLDTVGKESYVTPEDVANKHSAAGSLGGSGH